MIATTHKTHNKTYAPPKGWNAEVNGPCGSLGVRIARYSEELTSNTSHWCPDANELALLNAGGYVALTVVGMQPPVSLAVEMP